MSAMDSVSSMWSYMTATVAQHAGGYTAGMQDGQDQAALHEEAEGMTLAEERAKLDLVRQQLEDEDSNWQWRKEPASKIAQKTWLIHPDEDRRNEDVENVLKSTYDPAFKTAAFSQGGNLEAMRYDTKYLHPPRWYDSWTPNFLVGNRMHRLLGDSRIRNLDDKVECAQLLSKSEAHRDERNSHRQRTRLSFYLLVYAVLFAVPVAVELVFPVTTAGCYALNNNGIPDEDDPCVLRPHSPVGFWFALLMLTLAKASTVTVDWHWWNERFPAEFAWWRVHGPAWCQPDTSAPADEIDWWVETFPVVFRPDSLKYLEREWAPIAPVIALVVSIPCFGLGFHLVGAFVLLWAVAHLLRFAVQLLRDRGSPLYAKVQPLFDAASTVILYAGELMLALVRSWGPFLAGLFFVFTHFQHFNQGLLEVSPDADGFFGVRQKGKSLGLDSSKCMQLRPEEVVPFAYAYFGAAHVALFMLGAATLSLAELQKLKNEDRHILMRWVDIGGLLALNDVLAKSQALSSLRSWKDMAEGRLGSVEEALPVLGKRFKKVVPARFQPEESPVSSTFLEEDLKKTFSEGPQYLEGAFKPEELEKQIGDLILAVDLQTVSWPGVVMAMGFAFWATLEYSTASPCLLSPGDKCTVSFRRVFGWTGICGTDEYVLGLQTIALLFVLAVSAMLVTARAAQRARGRYAAVRIVAAVVGLAVLMLTLLTMSGLANTLHDISASAMPWMPISYSWVRDTILVVLPLELVVVSILAVQRGEEALDKRFPSFRAYLPGSLSTFVVFLFLLLYIITQGAFDFQNKSGSWTEGFRIFVYRGLLSLWSLRFLAFCAGKARLLKIAPFEAERFVERALLPEALGMIDSVSAQAAYATAVVPGTRREAWSQEAAWLRQCTRHKVQSGFPALMHRIHPSPREHFDQDVTSPPPDTLQPGETYIDGGAHGDDGYPSPRSGARIVSSS